MPAGTAAVLPYHCQGPASEWLARSQSEFVLQDLYGGWSRRWINGIIERPLPRDQKRADGEKQNDYRRIPIPTIAGHQRIFSRFIGAIQEFPTALSNRVATVAATNNSGSMKKNTEIGACN